MGVIGGACGVRILRTISPDGKGGLADGVPPAYRNRSKLQQLLGPGIWDEVRGKIVVDFGCGEGREVVEIAEHGARHVIGIDANPQWLDRAAALASEHRVADRCTFVRRWTRAGSADVVVSLDSFEHFDDPGDVLRIMHAMLRPGGTVLCAFGPTWYHPYGGHIFSVFPWAHCLFSEHAMVTWRSQLPGKLPTRSLREAGLNKMTVRRFRKLVAESPLEFASFDAVPIRRVPRLAHASMPEMTTSIVRCRLVARDAAAATSRPDSSARFATPARR